MTPEKSSDPQKGKVDETAVPEEAKDSKVEAAAKSAEQPEPKPKRTRKKAEPEAAETAAARGEGEAAAGDERSEADGVEKDAAEAEKPKRTPSAAEGGRGDERSEAGKADADDSPPADEPAAKEEPKAAPAPRERESAQRRNGQPEEPAVLVRAQARYVRTSARKARLVCAHIRGKDVAEARSILAFTPRAAAKPWLKLLESAVANAEHNHELVGEELRVFAVHADEGPTLKRYRPRAMGRATRIRKRTSHLTITLTPKES